ASRRERPFRTTPPMQQVAAASSPPRFLSRPRPDPCCTPRHETGCFFGSQYGHQGFGTKIWPRKEENCGLSSFPKCVAGMQPDPGITVNCCGDAATDESEPA